VGFFPLDRRLKLGAHHWTPETIKGVVRLGVEIASYRRAAETYQAVTKLALSKSALQTLVGEYGGQLVAIEAQEAEATVKAPARDEEVITARQMATPDSEVMAVSLDGVMINVRGEGWKEARVATISAVEKTVAEERDEEKEVRLTRHSYRAGLWEAKEFAKHQWAEGCRRGLERAWRIVAVADGAHWIWLIIMMCYAPCIGIIDGWHAVEKLWTAANGVFGAGDEQAAMWVEAQKHHLWGGNLRAMLAALRVLCPRGRRLNGAAWSTISYLYHNRRRMAYADYRDAGYPIGSGSVESACKVVVQARMKQAGMRWSRSGAQAMLALRSTLLSGRWDTIWPTLQPVPQPT
jgi:hypothetical protein